MREGNDRTGCPNITRYGLWKSFAATYPGLVASVTVLSFLFPIKMVVDPWLFGKFTSSVQAKSLPGIRGALTGMAIANLAVMSGYTLENYFQNDLDLTVEHFVTDYLTDALLRTPQIDKVDSGILLMKIKKFSRALSQLVRVWRVRFAPTLISLVFQSVFLYRRRDRVIGLIVGSIALVTLVVLVCAPQVSRQAHLSDERMYVEDFGLTTETLRHTSQLQESPVLIREAVVDQKERHARHRQSHKSNVGAALLLPIVIYTLVFLAIVAYFLRFYSLVQGQLPGDVGGVTEIVTVLLQVVNSVQKVASNIPDLVSNSVRGTSILEDLNVFLCPADTIVRREGPGVTLKISRVSFSYPGAAEPVLSGVSETFRPGVLCVVSGGNGTGKSTFLRLVAGLLPAAEGQVELTCTDSASAGIVYIPQSVTLFNRTIEYNLLLGNDIRDRQELEAGLRALGVWSKIEGMGGLDADVGLIGSKVSGGQRKLLALTRAMLYGKRLKVLLIDELENDLDVEMKKTIREHVARLAKQSIVVLSTHDEQFYRKTKADPTIRFISTSPWLPKK